MKQARVTAVAASLGAATLACGVLAGSSGAAAGVASLRVYERPGPTRVVHHGAHGVRATGDVVIFENPVFDRQGTRIGTDTGVCTVLNKTQSMCETTLLLPKGQIVTHGLQTAKTSFDVAVIGGTGFYAGARGTMTARPIKDGGATMVINLL
jgi:hypothetical protein